MSRRPASRSGGEAEHARAAQRIDQWLFFARLVKTRGLAQDLVAAGRVRINREKPRTVGHPVHPGDVLTIAFPGEPRVLRVLASAVRRGPASEARALYADLGRPEQGFSS